MHRIFPISQNTVFLLRLGFWCFGIALLLAGILLQIETGVFQALHYFHTAHGLIETAPALFLVCLIGGIVFDLYEKFDKKQ